MSRTRPEVPGCKTPDQRGGDRPKFAKCDGAASRHVPEMFPFHLTGEASSVHFDTFPLIRRGGDDGTRTHDPLLANKPTQDGCERLRTALAGQRRCLVRRRTPRYGWGWCMKWCISAPAVQPSPGVVRHIGSRPERASDTDSRVAIAVMVHPRRDHLRPMPTST